MLRWVHNACFDTTKIHVDSFERCFASRIAHNYAYCMKPPNIKAPKCTLYSALLSRVKGRKGSTVLPRLIASIVGGSLLRRAHFESLRAAEAKNAATINHLMSKRQSVSKQYFIIQGQRSQGLTGLATAPSEHRDGQLTSESPFRIVESG